MTELVNATLVWLGRLHPVLVHLPIGFLVLLAILECANGRARFHGAAAARPVVLAASVLSALVAAACGWLLAGEGDYAPGALSWHRWLGTALVPATLVLGLLGRSAGRVYRLWLVGTLALLICAGHFGGVLVRGEDYLFPWRGARPTVTPATDPAESGTPTIYATLIQPVFDQYCVGCHGPEKAKARLRLDSAEHLLAGGDSGSVIEPGDPARSLLLRRLRLPLASDEHMPPEGKPQPRPEQIALLEWWVRIGAPTDRPLRDLSLAEPR